MQARLGDAEVQEAALAQRRHALEEERLGRLASKLLATVLEDMVQSEGQITLVEAMRRHPRIESFERLDAHWEAWAAAVKNALSVLREHPELVRVDGLALEGRLRQLGIPLTVDELLIYLKVQAFLRDKADPRPFPPRGVRFTEEMLPEYVRASELESTRQLWHDKELVEHKLMDVRLLKADLGARLASDRRPPGLWWGLAVLVYLAIVGLLLPVALMPAAPGQPLVLGKWGPVGLFGAGLAAFFVYVVWLARRL